MTARYAERRRRLMDDTRADLVIVRGSGADGPNPNLYYLTGIAETRAALVLAPDGMRFGTGARYPGRGYVHGRRVSQILFLPEVDPLAARWGEAGSATVASVSAEDAGVDLVLPIGELEATLGQSLRAARLVSCVRGHVPSLGGPEDPDSALVARIRSRFLGVEVEDGTPRVAAMRAAKDEDEIAAIRRAGEVTAEALADVMRFVRPGQREHEVEARIAATYRRRGATHAFDPIVGCGDNALKLHYGDNDGPVDAGALLLIDTGARLDGYCADVTRTLPVDGRFTPRQREVYDVCLAALEAATAACRPGALLGDLHAIAWDVIDAAGLADAFVHGLGHHLGLEVHDAGDVHAPLEAGAVITIEPGIYLTDESIGIRIEDDVLITDDGPRVLTEAIPRRAEDVERAMAEGR